MKEEEAKGKVCPFRAMWGETRNGEDYYQDGNCIASDCMMWRWEVSPRSAAEINARGDAGAEATGYCGIPGKP